jgi:hypothetical protein
MGPSTVATGRCRKREPAKKKSPGAGSAEARTQYTERTYLPRPNITGQMQNALWLWQFFDDSLSNNKDLHP